MPNIATRTLKSTFLLVSVSLILSGCTDSVTKNENPLLAYASTLHSDAKFLSLNNFADIDQVESFEIGVSEGKVVFGDSSQLKKVNWGIAKSITPPSCQSESFWNASTIDFVASPELKGIATKLTSIELNASNYVKSQVGIIGQYTAVFNDEVFANDYFEDIKTNIALCRKDVFGVDTKGNRFQVTLKNTPTKNFRYYLLDNDAVMRTSNDGLILLDIFVKTRYSITLFKLFLNDMKLPGIESWSVLDELVNTPIQSICKIEQCIAPSIEIASSQQYVP